MKRTNYFNQQIAVGTGLRPCTYGKTRHTTRGHAEHALRKRQTPCEDRLFAVARCDSCRYWHVEVVGGVGPMPDFGQLPVERPALAQRPSGWNLNLKPVATCPRSKVRYHTIAEGESAIERLKSRDEYRLKAGVLNVYHCAECDAYHIGHRSD